MSQEKKCFKTSIGGQALIEGILMRGPKMQAIVCRTEDGLVEKTEELRSYVAALLFLTRSSKECRH